MPKHNVENERIKRAYFTHLKAARGMSEATIDAAAKAIHRFENLDRLSQLQELPYRASHRIPTSTRRGPERALRTATEQGDRAPDPQCDACLHSMARGAAGYRRRIRYSDADYFRLSEKDTRIAKSSRPREIPTPEQIKRVLSSMPTVTDIERRNRALVAFTWLTGVRDGALASLKVKHVNLGGGRSIRTRGR